MSGVWVFALAAAAGATGTGGAASLQAGDESFDAVACPRGANMSEFEAQRAPGGAVAGRGEEGDSVVRSGEREAGEGKAGEGEAGPNGTAGRAPQGGDAQAHPGEVQPRQAEAQAQGPLAGDGWVRGIAFEVNVLWPFFPGGLAELKVMTPLLNRARRDWRGELVTGLHSDYGWGPVTRPVDNYGKVFLLAAKIGWRQFLAWGFHVELALHPGWRHEERNVHDGTTVNGFVGRLWAFAGWQYELNQRVYANVRGGVGVHLWRSDHLGYTERRLAPAGDVNLGIRF